MAKIIIVEDEVKVACLLRDYLLREGFEVLMHHEGTGAVDLITREEPDLIILDLMLPGQDGLSICRELRRQSDIAILMLSARGDSLDRLAGLELGADDYVAKPFNPSEVVARVKGILRRTQRQTSTADTEVLQHKDITLDISRHRCEVLGDWVDLTPVEFRLLHVMMARPGQVYSRDALMELAYEDQRVVSRRTVDSHIKNLRRKLVDAGSSEVIRSVYGVGYSFEAV